MIIQRRENEKKENGNDKVERWKNKEKNVFFSYCLTEEKMEKKKIRKFYFCYLIEEKSDKKENVIIVNNLFTINLIY